jgi:hypothetical protein
MMIVLECAWRTLVDRIGGDVAPLSDRDSLRWRNKRGKVDRWAGILTLASPPQPEVRPLIGLIGLIA